MNVFTTCLPRLCRKYIKRLSSIVTIENNFEQIIAMAKNRELDKLCIFMDVWNVSGGNFNQLRGQSAAEKIHEIDPTIPILIWDGRTYDCGCSEIPCIFQVSGTIHPIKNPNELYLTFFSDSKIFKTTVKFFRGLLTEEDAPNKECLQFNFK